MRYLHRFIDIFWRAEGFEVVELFGALVTLGLGVYIGHPLWDIFSDYSELYAGMESVMPEWAWGVSLMGVGVFRLWAILHDSYAARKAGILLGTFAWFFMAYFILLTAPYILSTYFFFCLAAFSIWENIRLVRWQRRKALIIAHAHE